METLPYLLALVAARLLRRGKRAQALLYTLLSAILATPILCAPCKAGTLDDIVACILAHLQLVFASDLVYWLASRTRILDLLEH